MARTVLLAASALLVLAGCGAGPGRRLRVTSEAMAPTLHVGEIAVLRTDAYDDHGPARGDIVLVHPPRGAEEGRCGARDEGVDTGTPCGRAPGPPAPKIAFVKRVIGMPGDRISFRDGLAVVDGRRRDDPAARSCHGSEDPGCDFPQAVTVPAGLYYVLGDNRPNSSDSRIWGPVPRAAVIGRIDKSKG